MSEDLGAEYGFEPAVSDTGARANDPAAVPAHDLAVSNSTPAGTRRRIRFRKSSGATNSGATGSGARLRRKIAAGTILLAALGSMGGVYAAFAATSTASDTASSAQDIAAGQDLYQVSCITCHGGNLQGVTGQGPSLIGVGAAAVDFQVASGRMPLAQQGAYAPQHEVKFDANEIRQLAAYVQSVGGGPQIPAGRLRGGDSLIADGGALFRLNCASCHGTTFKGAPLSAGKIAPSLNDASDRIIWGAMLSGPENMPVFNNNQLTPEQKRAIVAYVQTMKASKDPGGNGIDRIGPVSEAIVIWVAGVGAVVIAILWIGAKSR